MSPELITAIKERINLGYTKESICDELCAVGYSDEIINAAYAEAESELVEVSKTSVVQEAASLYETGGEKQLEHPVKFPGFFTLIVSSLRFSISRFDFVLLFIAPVFLQLLYPMSMSLGVGFKFALFFWYFILFISLHFILINSEVQKVSMAEAIKWAFKNLIGMSWVIVLMVIVIGVGTLLFVIPGIIASVYLFLSTYVYAQEGLKGVSALKRSYELIKGNWWNTAHKLFYISGLFFVFSVLCVFVGIYSYYIGQFMFMFISVLLFSALPLFWYLVFSNFGFQIYRFLRANESQDIPVGWVTRLFLGIFLLVSIVSVYYIFSYISNEITYQPEELIEYDMDDEEWVVEMDLQENQNFLDSDAKERAFELRIEEDF